MARTPLQKKRLGEKPPERGVGRAPREHRVAPPPNPRKPELVRDVHGGVLKDLFQMFPDLPRPVRPAARVPLRARRRP